MLSALVVFLSLAFSTNHVECSTKDLKRNLYTHDINEPPKPNIPLPVRYNLDIIPGLAKFPMSKELKEALDNHFLKKYTEKKRMKRANAGKKRRAQIRRSRVNGSKKPKSKSWHVLERRGSSTPVAEVTIDPTSRIPSDYEEKPIDLYRSALKPGVIFRINMAEALLKMQNRNYIVDEDESIIDADMEYIRLTRKVLVDEITKLEDYIWQSFWFINKTDLERNHTCDVFYTMDGVPASNFSTAEEFMKRQCLFKGLYLDYVPYVVGKDQSIMAAVAPPVLHCDAGTCTSVPFVDSLMFEPELPIANVRLLTKCDAGCRKYCKNDPKCLERCAKYCNTRVTDMKKK